MLPIPGTKNLGRLKENLGALDLALSPAEMEAIAEVGPSLRQVLEPAFPGFPSQEPSRALNSVMINPITGDEW